MASTTSFKQTCPSCEATVPIKDASLVGKKIDCPKCKYRFVVEAPADSGNGDVEEEEPKKAKKDAGKAKAKGTGQKVDDDYEEDEEGLGRARRKKKKESGGTNTKLVIGIGIAVVAVAILGVAGYFMFSGDDETPTTTGSTPSAPTANIPEEKTDEPKQAVADVPPSTDITNLLPRDTEVVVNLPVKEVMNSSLGMLSRDLSPGAKTQEFQRMFGVAPEDVDRVLLASNVSQSHGFIVFHTTKPVAAGAIKKTLSLKAEPPIQGQDYFSFNWLEMMKKHGMINSAQLALLSFNQTLYKSYDKAVYVRFHDPQTVVVADAVPMKEFLGHNGKPPVYKAETETPNPGGRGGRRGPGFGKPGMAGTATPPGVGGGSQMMAMYGAGEGQQGGEKKKEQRVTGSYMTINPRLKAMMDRLEEKPVLLSLAVDTDAKFSEFAALNKSMAKVTPVSTVGVAVQSEGGIGLVAAAEFRTDREAQSTQQMALMLGDDAKEQIESAIDLAVEWIKPNLSAAAGFGPMGDTGMGGMGMGMRPGAPGMQGGPGGAGGQNMGMMMQQQMMRNRMMQQQGGRGGMMPPAMPGMPGANAEGAPADAAKLPVKEDKPTFGKLTFDGPNLSDRTLTMTVKLDKDGYDYLYQNYVAPVVKHQKGEMDMQMARPRPHDLARALQTDADKQMKYPRGAYNRMLPPGRLNRAWLPDDRVSWMSELLPHLGYGEIHAQINFQKSWRDKDNLNHAMTLIPQFLDPAASPFDRYSRYPGVKNEVASTHFVGVAGVGPDAADYSAQDVATAKRRGVFGYDRETQLSDLGGGTSNTIVMLQVPPNLRGPWMAGGGATVRGVPEKDSVKPFVSTTYNGQRGTMAVMADGSVRFVSEKVNDKVFQELCVVDKSKSRSGLDMPTVPDDRPELKAMAAPPVALTAPAAPKADDKKSAPGLLARLQSAAQGQKKSNDLKMIVLAYHNFHSSQKKAPAKAEDLQSSLTDAPEVYKALQAGQFVVLWGSDFKNMTQGTSNTVLAYEKDVPAKGGPVAMADGSVKTMTAEEFQKATKAAGK